MALMALAGSELELQTDKSGQLAVNSKPETLLQLESYDLFLDVGHNFS